MISKMLSAMWMLEVIFFSMLITKIVTAAHCQDSNRTGKRSRNQNLLNSVAPLQDNETRGSSSTSFSAHKNTHLWLYPQREQVLKSHKILPCFNIKTINTTSKLFTVDRDGSWGKCPVWTPKHLPAAAQSQVAFCYVTVFVLFQQEDMGGNT